MTITYSLLKSDIDLLARRQGSPCFYPNCPKGKSAEDYAWMGCGEQISCPKYQEYLNWTDAIQKANLTTLANYLLSLDDSIRKVHVAEKEVENQKNLICKTFGASVLHILDEKLYEGFL